MDSLALPFAENVVLLAAMNKPGTDIGGARTKSHREGVEGPGQINNN